MRNEIKETAAVVLAAGMGTRMDSDIPKVLHVLDGRPLVRHVIDSLKRSGIEMIIVVVGYRGEMVIDSLGNDVRYVWQHEQLGTGHAVMQAEPLLRDYPGRVLVACGDVPLISPETYRDLAAAADDSVKAAVLTMEPENPAGYGRIIKDETGNFMRIIEDKDASDDEKRVREVNTGTYVFDRDYLFRGLGNINTDNVQNEYYLPDALNYIIESGFSVKALKLVNAIEGTGINTRDELLAVERYVNENY